MTLSKQSATEVTFLAMSTEGSPSVQMVQGSSPYLGSQPCYTDCQDLERCSVLCLQERDGYKSIITQYESEATITLSSETSARTQQLEETVNNYHKQLASVENDLQVATKQLVEYKTKSWNG